MPFLPRIRHPNRGTIPRVTGPWRFSNMRIDSSAEPMRSEFGGNRLNFLPARGFFRGITMGTKWVQGAQQEPGPGR